MIEEMLAIRNKVGKDNITNDCKGTPIKVILDSRPEVILKS